MEWVITCVCVCYPQVKLALEANQILEATLHLQNLLVAPQLAQQGQPSSSAALGNGTSETYGTMRRPVKPGGAAAMRPASMILPNKAPAPMFSPKAFSPRKEENKMGAHHPVKVDHSISQPAPTTLQVSSPPVFHHSTADTGNLSTDYPRMRAASSMTNLPTDAGVRTDPKATRAMLEAWKKDKIGATREKASPAQSSNPVPLHYSPRPGGPRAVVEIPGGRLPPKNQGRQYMSSPNILQDSSDPSMV